MITLAKKGTIHARRLAHRDVHDAEALAKLFDTIAPRFAARPGGYTRVVRVSRRAGDNAELAMIELVERTPAAPAEGEDAAKGEGKKSEKKASKKSGKAAESKSE